MIKGIMPEKTGKQGLELIRSFEGFQPSIYKCPAGRPTIGFGHVVKDDEDFPNLLTVQDAYDLLKEDLKPVEEAIHETVDSLLSASQFDALASFIFNIGIGAWRESSFLKRLKEGADYYDASSEFLRWIYAGKKKLRGLMRRREAERNLFIKGIVC